MKTQIATISIEKLATELNGKIWTKGNITRIYLDKGYNTKKMSTNCYVYQKEDLTYGVVCRIECPSQNATWIRSQEQQVVESVMEQINEILNEQGEVVEAPVVEMVKGYRLVWKECRISVNRFGKLETRKRQFVQTFEGMLSEAPQGFIQLDDEQFAKAKQMELDEVKFQYGETPVFA